MPVTFLLEMRISRVFAVAVLLCAGIYAADLIVAIFFVESNPCLVPSSVECWLARTIHM